MQRETFAVPSLVRQETDREAFEAAARGAGARDLSAVRAVRIQNTLRCGRCWVSEALLPEIAANPRIRVVSDARRKFTDTAGCADLGVWHH